MNYKFDIQELLEESFNIASSDVEERHITRRLTGRFYNYDRDVLVQAHDSLNSNASSLNKEGLLILKILESYLRPTYKRTITFKQRLNLVLGAKQNQREPKWWPVCAS